MLTTGITEVTSHNNEVITEINHNADFQAQLEEIDSELARYDNIGDSVHGHLAGSQDVGLHGPEIMGHQSSGKHMGQALMRRRLVTQVQQKERLFIKLVGCLGLIRG